MRTTTGLGIIAALSVTAGAATADSTKLSKPIAEKMLDVSMIPPLCHIIDIPHDQGLSGTAAWTVVRIERSRLDDRTGVYATLLYDRNGEGQIICAIVEWRLLPERVRYDALQRVLVPAD